jgi:hypothetical protein
MTLEIEKLFKALNEYNFEKFEKLLYKLELTRSNIELVQSKTIKIIQDNKYKEFTFLMDNYHFRENFNSYLYMRAATARNNIDIVKYLFNKQCSPKKIKHDVYIGMKNGSVSVVNFFIEKKITTIEQVYEIYIKLIDNTNKEQLGKITLKDKVLRNKTFAYYINNSYIKEKLIEEESELFYKIKFLTLEKSIKNF